jgi:hypothetical protein
MREYAKKPFTDLTVRSLEEGYHFDGKMPRFGIWVGKNRRTWIVLRGPRSDKIKIGGYPDMSLAEARSARISKI